MKKNPPPTPVLTRVLIVDDHPAFRLGITRVIDAEGDMKVCGEAGDAPNALSAMRQLQPDVAIVDVSMPGANGIELLKSMHAEFPNLPLLTLSAHDESTYAMRAIRAGALGYVMKNQAVDLIAIAIRKVASGEPFLSRELSQRLLMHAVHSLSGGLGAAVDVLSDRELEVLTLAGRGFSAQDTATELKLGLKTIETHRAHIKEKLGFQTSREMIRFAIEWSGSLS